MVLAAGSQLLQPGSNRPRDTKLFTVPFRPDALISLPEGPDVILGTARKGQSQGGVISTAAPPSPPSCLPLTRPWSLPQPLLSACSPPGPALGQHSLCECLISNFILLGCSPFA